MDTEIQNTSSIADGILSSLGAGGFNPEPEKYSEYDGVDIAPGTGQKMPLMDMLFTPAERREILDAEYASLISRSLDRLLSGGPVRPHALVQGFGGRRFDSMAHVALDMQMSLHRDWQPVFLSAQEMGEMGLELYQGSDPVSIVHREAGGLVVRDLVWNISDTDYPDRHPVEWTLLKEKMEQQHRHQHGGDNDVYRRSRGYFNQFMETIMDSPYSRTLDAKDRSLIFQMSSMRFVSAGLMSPGCTEAAVAAMKETVARRGGYETFRLAGELMAATDYGLSFGSTVDFRKEMPEMLQERRERMMAQDRQAEQKHGRSI